MQVGADLGEKQVNIKTIGGTTCEYCSVRVVSISANEGDSAKIDVLVVHSKPLKFYLLFGINAIKALGGIVWPTGSVQLGDRRTTKCAAISTNATNSTKTANRLTQIPQQWLEAMKKENGLKPLIGTALVDKLDTSQIMAIHRGSGLLGVQRTTYFVRRICPTIAKAAIKSAIRMSKECQSIDPALIHWEKGKLEVNRNWQRLGMDIAHYNTHHFLTLTDCGPSCFSIWKQLARQDSASMIHQLEAVFFECGTLHEILTDNETAFCSKEFQDFTQVGNSLTIPLRIRPSQE